MKKKFKTVSIIFFPVLFIIQCTEPCRIYFYYKNQLPFQIAIIASESNYFFAEKNKIIDSLSTEYDASIGEGDPDLSDVPSLLSFDSLMVVFKETDTIVHYRDSLKGNYQRSLFNIDAYDLNNCTYIYSFTEDDYKNAQKF